MNEVSTRNGGEGGESVPEVVIRRKLKEERRDGLRVAVRPNQFQSKVIFHGPFHGTLRRYQDE